MNDWPSFSPTHPHPPTNTHHTPCLTLQVRNEFYRDAQGALLVFDVNDRPSFSALESWLDEARRYGAKGMAMVVAGNKVRPFGGRGWRRGALLLGTRELAGRGAAIRGQGDGDGGGGEQGGDRGGLLFGGQGALLLEGKGP